MKKQTYCDNCEESEKLFPDCILCPYPYPVKKPKKIKKLIPLVFLLLILVGCKKEEQKMYYPCVPVAFTFHKGNFELDLPDMKAQNVKEVRWDFRSQVSDTFRIKVIGRDGYCYLEMSEYQATLQNMMVWIVPGDDCLNMVHGTVTEDCSGYLNIVYWF